MSLENCAISTADVSLAGGTFLTFLDEAPNVLEPLEIPLPPNKLYGWHNGTSDMVEMFVSSVDGRYLNRLASGIFNTPGVSQ